MHQDLLHLPVFAYMRMHMHEQSYSEKHYLLRPTKYLVENLTALGEFFLKDFHV